MIQIVPEIYIKNCKQALPFYLNLFGGEVKNVQLSEDLPAFNGLKDKIIHSELHVNGKCVFYFVDIFDKKRERAGNVTLVLHLEDKLKLENCFNALSEGGEVGMPPQETFWGELHAIVTDRFGAPWALSAR